MTKQHYITLANSIKSHIEAIKEETQYEETENTIAEVKYCISYFVRVIKQENPRFDEKRFYEACGL